MTAGLLKSRLERLHHVLPGYIERQEIPGIVALVSHHDDVHVETLGSMVLGQSTPMERDNTLSYYWLRSEGCKDRGSYPCSSTGACLCCPASCRCIAVGCTPFLWGSERKSQFARQLILKM